MSKDRGDQMFAHCLHYFARAVYPRFLESGANDAVLSFVVL